MRAGGVSLYTLWQLVTMHEHEGKRFSRYHELAQVCFAASCFHQRMPGILSIASNMHFHCALAVEP